MDLKIKFFDISRSVLKQLGVAPLAIRLLPYLPPKIKKSIKHHHYKVHKHKAVPEKELEIAYRKALTYLGRNGAAGDYLEFGVFYGASMACMYRAAKDLGWDTLRFFGFDSFEGLPKKSATKDIKGHLWDEGDFKAELQDTKQFLAEAQVDLNRVVLTKGFFADSLTDELVRKYDILKASLIMIDCDLYEGAKQALNFCAPLIRDEAIVFFDDWISSSRIGERLAFEEFLAENTDLRAEEFTGYWYTEASPPVYSPAFLIRRTL